MRLPRDVSGNELAKQLKRYGYEITRQTAHLRLTSTIRGFEHDITIPAHKALRVGTLSAILSDIAGYLDLPKEELAQELFGRRR